MYETSDLPQDFDYILHLAVFQLAAASVPATIVNWSDDEPVDVRSWCNYLGEMAGKTPANDFAYTPCPLDLAFTAILQ